MIDKFFEWLFEEHPFIFSLMVFVQIKQLGYKGCKNCQHQIAPLRMCKWAEQGGDGRIHFICPKWDKRGGEERQEKT